MSGKHILIVDDDRRLRELLKQFLSAEGFSVSAADSAEEAKKMLSRTRTRVDMIVLDVMMPGQSGVEFTKAVRGSSDIPILMLTAMGEVENRIEGLESGADDYLVKPFEPRELSLRITKLLGRNMKRREKQKLVKFGDFIFNINNGDLKKVGRNVSLTSSEQELLTIFAKSMNMPVSRDELSFMLNGISGRSVDVQVTRLRKKIEDDPKNPTHLKTSWGEGYVLKSD